MNAARFLINILFLIFKNLTNSRAGSRPSFSVTAANGPFCNSSSWRLPHLPFSFWFTLTTNFVHEIQLTGTTSSIKKSIPTSTGFWQFHPTPPTIIWACSTHVFKNPFSPSSPTWNLWPSTQQSFLCIGKRSGWSSSRMTSWAASIIALLHIITKKSCTALRYFICYQACAHLLRNVYHDDRCSWGLQLLKLSVEDC